MTTSTLSLGQCMPAPPAPASLRPAWQLGHWRDRDIELSVQRKTLLAILGTVLLHLLLLYALTRPNPHSGQAPAAASQAPLELAIGLLDKPPAAPEQAPVRSPARSPRTITSKPAEPAPETPADIPPVAQRPTISPPPPAEKALDLAPPPAADLSSYMAAMKERRRAAEQQASGYEAPPPSAEEQRMANIRRNLQAPGTNGIFQIISKGTLRAQFTFRGWTGNASNARSQLFEVSVAPGGDIERAMVQRMIGLIRQHYDGNFNWESRRLGRVIVLSARLEDNAGLEDFLLRELFG